MASFSADNGSSANRPPPAGEPRPAHPSVPKAGSGPAGVAPRFDEQRDPSIDQALLSRTVGELKLALRGTRLERLVDQLYAEMGAAGIAFRPVVYLSDEWGCPDQVPIIGVPFYLADERLTRLHDTLMEGVEAESDRDVLRYLRHEAGHAFNYAYRLFESSEWTDLFGPFVRPYPDEYHPHPYSRSFVRHLPAWYAQKHPDEDFAETFAVWLDPASNWRKVYAGWPCLKKLEYVDRIAKEVGPTPPVVTAEDYDTDEDFWRVTVAELYQRWATPAGELPRMFDSALEDIFPRGAPDSKAMPAERFLHRHRRAIVAAVFHWTGLDDAPVRTLVSHLQQRCAELDLRVGSDPDATLIQIVAFITMLATNRVQTGEFVRS